MVKTRICTLQSFKGKNKDFKRKVWKLTLDKCSQRVKPAILRDGYPKRMKYLPQSQLYQNVSSHFRGRIYDSHKAKNGTYKFVN